MPHEFLVSSLGLSFTSRKRDKRTGEHPIEPFARSRQIFRWLAVEVTPEPNLPRPLPPRGGAHPISCVFRYINSTLRRKKCLTVGRSVGRLGRWVSLVVKGDSTRATCVPARVAFVYNFMYIFGFVLFRPRVTELPLLRHARGQDRTGGARVPRVRSRPDRYEFVFFFFSSFLKHTNSLSKAGGTRRPCSLQGSKSKKPSSGRDSREITTVCWRRK